MVAEVNLMYRGALFRQFVEKSNEVAKKLQQYENRVLYGFSFNRGGGTYVEWMFRKIYGIAFDYIVDDEENSYMGDIYRENLFDYLNSKDTIVIAADCNRKSDVIHKSGYVEGENFIDLLQIYGLDRFGYFEYLQKTYGLDICGRSLKTDVVARSKDANRYAVSREMGIPDVCQYLVENYPQSRILDIGCGKGGAMIALRDFGFETVDGIELLDELCEIARSNLRTMDMDCHVFECGGDVFEHYDDYDLYYFYNSYKGDTLDRTMGLIESSAEKRRRKVIFVYADPWAHNQIVRNGKFRLKSQLKGDWFTRFVNIYEYEVR